MHRVASKIIQWWGEPDNFDWVSEFLRGRDLLRPTRIIMAIVAASAALVALSALFQLNWPTWVLLSVGLIGCAMTVGMTAFWMTRWPTRRQSEVAIVVGTLFIGVWSLTQPMTAVALLAATATAVTGGYIAFFHNMRLLLLNYAVTATAAGSACVRLAADSDLITAAVAFWLIWFINATIPVAIRAITSTMRAYATRSGSDPLTGLLNRRGFADAVARQPRDAANSATCLGVMMVDLDNFKSVNDTLGHAAGDRTLLAVTDTLRTLCPPSAAICRAGGEEFLVALATHRGDAESIANKLCHAIAELPDDITASIGTSSIGLEQLRAREPGAVLDDLIAAADDAMYVAKRNGGNRVHAG